MVQDVFLTDLELQVLQRTLKAKNLKEVAIDMGLSISKALYIKRSLYKKFKVHSNSELIVKCWELKK
jgi:DNA-binding CsgD family transcriptional regulator